MTVEKDIKYSKSGSGSTSGSESDSDSGTVSIIYKGQTMTLFDINRILLPIKRKIFLIIGRAILAAVDNSEDTQKIQVTGLNGETITGIERLQEYGFESYPKKEAEVVIGFINGNRDQGIAIKVHDRRYRPDDLSEGDVKMYDYRGTEIIIDANGVTIKTGDASTWKPCILGTCLFSGAPHGGTAAGIDKLKGA